MVRERDLTPRPRTVRAWHERAPALDTVIGHAYASTMVGAAATSGDHLDADHVVSVGSPGMLADHASDLNVNSRAPIYASQNDITQFATGTSLGPGPVDDNVMTRSNHGPGSPSFSATEVDSDKGHVLGPRWMQWASVPPIEAHPSYFGMGSAGLLNMGQIIAGDKPNHAAK